MVETGVFYIGTGLVCWHPERMVNHFNRYPMSPVCQTQAFINNQQAVLDQWIKQNCPPGWNINNSGFNPSYPNCVPPP
jgi:hypothetical protein